MAVSRIDLLNHTFSRSFRGYAPQEVERLLQDLADTLGRLGDEKVALSGRVAQLEARLAEYQQREVALRDIMVSSQRMSEDMKAAAQQEAQLILEAARAKAESLVNQGNMRLARILEDVSNSRKLKMQFALKLKSVIEGHLQLLDLEREEDAKLEQEAAQIGASVHGSPGSHG